MMAEFTSRQKEIIGKAINIISEKGIQELTMKNIAGRINVTEPAIYRHFDNKMNILLAILEYYKTEIEILRKKSEEEEGCLKKIESYTEGHFKNFKKQPAVASIFFAEEIFISDKVLSKKIWEIIDLNQQYIIKTIEEGIAGKEIRNDIPAEYLSIMIMGSFRLLIRKWRSSGYKYDLAKEGKNLWANLNMVIKK
jgi:TetR/AcrR family fatty acid metabolism transcriptional regulator